MTLFARLFVLVLSLIIPAVTSTHLITSFTMPDTTCTDSCRPSPTIHPSTGTHWTPMDLTTSTSSASTSATPLSLPIVKRVCKPDCDIVATRLLLIVSMAEFQLAHSRRDPPEFEWNLGGCTHGTSNRPSGFNFLYSCQRHNFGLRNYRPGGRWDSRTRNVVDDQLARDLEEVCARVGGREEVGAKEAVERRRNRDKCRQVAAIYVAFMREERRKMVEEELKAGEESNAEESLKTEGS